MGGKIYTLLGAWYHATKHALEGWSDCLRLELAPFGIRVVVVEPGLIETGFGDVVADGLLARSGKGAANGRRLLVRCNAIRPDYWLSACT
jgi:NAD(P)-dependent dehydrogenase (short-subunit alcohol dehydrogenase family)